MLQVSAKAPLTAYSDLVDLFFQSDAARFLAFKCLVVRRSDDPSDSLPKLDKDYRLLQGVLHASAVPLDHRTSPRSHPEGDVGRCLNAIAKRDRLAFRVLLCTAPSSKSEDLLQLADIFCGAVGWAWNGMDSICGAKPILHERICKHLKWATLEKRATGLAAEKLNVWLYRPRPANKAGRPRPSSRTAS